MWEAFDYHPPPSPPPKRRARTRRRHNNEHHADDDSIERSPVMTPRTRRRRTYRHRHESDRYRTPSTCLNTPQTFDFDGAEVFSQSPVERLSRQRLQPLPVADHEDQLLCHSKENKGEESSDASNAFVVGEKQYPISLDSCVFDAGGFIFDTIDDLTGNRQQQKSLAAPSIQHVKEQVDVHSGIQENAAYNATSPKDILDEDLLDEDMLDAILEMAADNNPCRSEKPDFRRVLSLDELEEEDLRRKLLSDNADNDWARGLHELEQPSLPDSQSVNSSEVSLPSRPVTPTTLRSPNESAESALPIATGLPMTPTGMRSPASSVRDEPKDVGPPEAISPVQHQRLHIITHHLPMDAPETMSLDEDRKVKSPDAPPQLTIRIPCDDESFSNSSTWDGGPLSFDVSPKDSAREAESDGEQNHFVSEQPIASSDEDVNLSTPLMMSVRMTSPCVDELEDTAKFLEKLAAAPSLKELNEARAYLAKLTRTPSPKELRDARSFFEQILELETGGLVGKPHVKGISPSALTHSTTLSSSPQSTSVPASPSRRDDTQYQSMPREHEKVLAVDVERDPNHSWRVSQSQASDGCRLRRRYYHGQDNTNSYCASEVSATHERHDYSGRLQNMSASDGISRQSHGSNRGWRYSSISREQNGCSSELDLPQHVLASPEIFLNDINVTHTLGRRDQLAKSALRKVARKKRRMPPLLEGHGQLRPIDVPNLMTNGGFVSKFYGNDLQHVADNTGNDSRDRRLGSPMRSQPRRQTTPLTSDNECVVRAQRPFSNPHHGRVASIDIAHGEGDENGDVLVEIISEDSSMTLLQMSDTMAALGAHGIGMNQGSQNSSRPGRQNKFPLRYTCADRLDGNYITELESDEAKDDLIEIISDAGSSFSDKRRCEQTCQVAQNNWCASQASASKRRTTFPPFGALPDIPELPEVFSQEDEVGPDTELVYRKRNNRSSASIPCLEVIVDNTNSCENDSHQSSLVQHPRKGGPEELHRHDYPRYQSDSSIHLLELESSNDTPSRRHQVLPRMGGPESLSFRRESASDSDIPSRPALAKRRISVDTLCERDPLAGLEVPSSPVFNSHLRAPAPRPDRKKRQSKDCPASLYIRPTGNTDKEDAPGVTLLGKVPAGEADIIFVESFHHQQSVIPVTTTCKTASLQSQSSDIRMDDAVVKANLSDLLENSGKRQAHAQQCELRANCDIPTIENDRKAGSEASESVGVAELPEAGGALTCDGSFGEPHARNAIGLRIPVAGAGTGSSGEQIQTCDEASQSQSYEIRPSTVSSIFRGVAASRPSQSSQETHILRQPAAPGGTFENPLSILDQCVSAVQDEDRCTRSNLDCRLTVAGDMKNPLTMEDQVLGQARNAGIILLQPNINIYTSDPQSTSTNAHDDLTKKVGKLVHQLLPDARKVTEKHEVAESSSDEHTIIFIEDLSSCGDHLPLDDKYLPSSKQIPATCDATACEPLALERDRDVPSTKPTREEISELRNTAPTRVPSFKALDNRLSEMDQVLSRAVNAVRDSPLTNDVDVKDDRHDNDGLDEELSNLGDSVDLLRLELEEAQHLFRPDLGRNLPVLGKQQQRANEDGNRNTFETSPSSSGVLESDTSSSSNDHGDHGSATPRHGYVTAFDVIDHSPLYMFTADDRTSPQLMLQEERQRFAVKSNTKTLDQNSSSLISDDQTLEKTVEFAVLHSRLQDDVEVIHLRKPSIGTDDSSEEIEVIFVDNGFLADEFFRYGESKGMVFYWIHRARGNTKTGRTIANLTSARQSHMPSSYDRPPRTGRISQCSAPGRASPKLRKQRAVVPPETKHAQHALSEERHGISSVRPRHCEKREVISLLHIEEPQDVPIFRHRRAGTLQIAPHYSASDIRSRTGLDPEDCLTLNRSGRTGWDPPGAAVDIRGGESDSFSSQSQDSSIHSSQFLTSSSSLSSAAPFEVKLQDEADSVELKRRIEAILNRSSHETNQSIKSAELSSFAIRRGPGKTEAESREGDAVIISLSFSDVSDLLSQDGHETEYAHDVDGANRRRPIPIAVAVGCDGDKPLINVTSDKEQDGAIPAISQRLPPTMGHEEVPRTTTLKRSPRVKIPGWNLARNAASAIRGVDRRRRVMPNRNNGIQTFAHKALNQMRLAETNQELPSNLFFVPLYPRRQSSEESTLGFPDLLARSFEV